MGIADFFLGEKQQDVPSLNDLLRFQNRSQPDITGPGFNIRTGANDGKPFARITEDPSIKLSRKRQQNLSASLAGQLGGVLGDQDFSRIDADPEAAARVEQALFDRGFNLLEPVREQRRDRTVQALADRGLPAGSEARREELELLGQQENEELNDLVLRAILARDQSLGADVNRQLAARGDERTQLNNFIAQIQSLLSPQTGVPIQAPGPRLSGGDILAPSAQQGAFDQQRNQGQQQLLAGLISGGARVAPFLL